MFGFAIISSVHTLETWRPKTSVILPTILLSTLRRRRHTDREKIVKEKKIRG